MAFDLLDAELTTAGVDFGDLAELGDAWRIAKTDLSLFLRPRQDGAVVGVLEYATSLFEPATVERFGAQLLRLLEQAAAAPDTRLADMELLTSEERRRQLVEWNPGAGQTVAVPAGTTVLEMIEARAAERPDAPALTGAETVTFGALDAAANRIAHRLGQSGAGAESVVGVLLDRGPDLLTAFLGSWKTGAGYLPLDPEHPADRIAAMLADAGVSVLITSAAHGARVAHLFPGELVVVDRERDELYMVVDEELKMMARICGPGLRVKGPRLKEMGRLAHTEYLIEVDSAILIRTADLDAQGRLGIGVGATLVRHSDPWSEVAETRAKTAALLEPAYPAEPAGLSGHPAVRAALARRHSNVAGFWLRPPPALPHGHHPALSGRSALLVDAEDTFTSMLALQLDSLGLSCTVRRHDESYDLGAYDLVVMGPGPGDPREVHRPKIARLRADLARLVDERRPFLAVCLSHQLLSTLLGLHLGRRPVPNQGTQRTIDLFGEPQRVGFYNTFAAHSDTDRVHGPTGVVEVGRDPDTGDVHALRGPGFASTQFHPESFLTENGPAVLQAALAHALRPLASSIFPRETGEKAKEREKLLKY